MIPHRPLLAILFRPVCVALAFCAVSPSRGLADDASDVALIAATTAGKVRGYLDQGIHAFKGIPYGGDTAKRRFQAPVPPDPWEGVRDATAFAAMAPQTRPAEGASEDCLRLNVWTPALRDGHRRPVLVYFHGGAYNNGSVTSNLYDGVRLSRRGDVVVVTVNGRLNGFGFLYLGDLGGPEFADSGNAGMLDLVLSLKWVHDNIAEFGGDPGNVTIFGQSGGGNKCTTLMALPAAHGLFHRVWGMSGNQIFGRTRAAATADARAVLQALGLTPDRLDEIKTMPMAKLIAAMRAGTWEPVRDGRNLLRDPFSPDAPPLSADIPMVVGNTHDETTYLMGRGDPAIFQLTWGTLPDHLAVMAKQYIGNLSPKDIVAFYRQLYPRYTPSDVYFAATTAARSWPGALLSSERRAIQGAPTWVYNLVWPSPVDGGKWKAGHTLDIPLVFDNVAYGADQTGGGADAQQMADAMSDALIALARTGNPNTPAIPFWPQYSLPQRPTMLFDLPSHVEDDPRGAERKFFAPVVAARLRG
jgi:para-nitrobenzyl esterase